MVDQAIQYGAASHAYHVVVAPAQPAWPTEISWSSESIGAQLDVSSPVELFSLQERVTGATAVAESSVQGTKRNRGRLGLSAVLVAGLAALATVEGLGPARAQTIVRSPTAHAAHTLNANDIAHLHLVKSSGSLLYEEGSASGGLSGHMKAALNIGATFTGSFTIYTSAGTIKGYGTATPHGSGRYESFAGSVAVTGGSRRYAHAHGKAGFYGTFDRQTYAFVIQTTGKLSY